MHRSYSLKQNYVILLNILQGSLFHILYLFHIIISNSLCSWIETSRTRQVYFVSVTDIRNQIMVAYKWVAGPFLQMWYICWQVSLHVFLSWLIHQQTIWQNMRERLYERIAVGEIHHNPPCRQSKNTVLLDTINYWTKYMTYSATPPQMWRFTGIPRTHIRLTSLICLMSY